MRVRYEPIDLFAFVPKLSLETDLVLTEMDHLPEDDATFQGRLRYTAKLSVT